MSEPLQGQVDSEYSTIFAKSLAGLFQHVTRLVLRANMHIHTLLTIHSSNNNGLVDAPIWLTDCMIVMCVC